MKGKKIAGTMLAFLLASSVIVPSSAIVGRRDYINDQTRLFELSADMGGFPYLKVWIYCESGSVQVSIVDENGNTVSGCEVQALQSGIAGGDSYVFWAELDDSEEEEHYLKLTSESDDCAAVWFNFVEADSKPTV